MNLLWRGTIGGRRYCERLAVHCELLYDRTARAERRAHVFVVNLMRVRSSIVCAAALGIAVALPVGARGEGIDTEHLFGFMIGTDVGTPGEREFQSQSGGQLGKRDGTYRSAAQEFEVEWVPAANFRVELGTSFAAHDIHNVDGLDNRRQLGWQGLSLDLRYRWLDRDVAPFGMTFGLESHADRIDEVSAAPGRVYGTGLTLAFDRELVPNVVLAALNLSYQPEWTRLAGSPFTEHDATLAVATAVMVQPRPGLLIGGEARYLRRYDGFGLDALAGQALFVGPTAYLQLSERSRLTAAWSIQAWGRASGSAAALDLTNFERHQARIIYGVNF